MIGQTSEIAPADRFLYALRDATATVESIPLIAASIMSKKLAEGIDGLVLDVKTGGGAFMQREDDSRALARAMCSIGAGLGKDMVALITRMDQPLGNAVGNAVEVVECIDCLRGGGPPDLRNLSIELAAEMVLLAGRSATIEGARSVCKQTIADGSALERFRKLVQAQGGDPRAVDDPDRLPAARSQDRSRVGDERICAGARSATDRPRDDAAGRGRARMDSRIDPSVGAVLHKKVGARLKSTSHCVRCSSMMNRGWTRRSRCSERRSGSAESQLLPRRSSLIGSHPGRPDRDLGRPPGFNVI